METSLTTNGTTERVLAPTIGYLNRFKASRHYDLAKVFWVGIVKRSWQTEEDSLRSMAEIVNSMKDQFRKSKDPTLDVDTSFRAKQIGNAIELCYKAISLWHRDHHYKQ